MANKDTETLIQEAVDRVISDDDQTRLSAILASDASARRELEDHRALSGILRSMPTASAPDGFTDSVMAALPRKDASAPQRLSLSEVLAGFFAAPQMRLVYAALAGAVVAAAVTFSAVKPLPGDLSGMTGTMGAAPDAGVTLQADAGDLEVTASRLGDSTVGLTIAASAPIAGTAAFDTNRFRILDIRYVEGPMGRLDVENGTIRFVADGAATVFVRLDGDAAGEGSFEVRTVSGGDTVSRTLSLPATQ